MFREDVLAKMQRHAVLKPQLEDEPLLYRHVSHFKLETLMRWL